MNKIVLELDKPLKDGELLIYKDGIVKSVDIHELVADELAELHDVERKLETLTSNFVELAKIVKEKNEND